MKNRISSKQTVRGFAFAESIFVGGSGNRHYGKEDSGNFFRGFFLSAILVIFIAALFLRLFFLTVIKGEEYRALSNSNRTRISLVHAPRGIIFDRHGIPLVYNVPGFRTIENGKVRLLDRQQAIKEIAAGKENISVDSLRNYPFKEATSHVLGYIGQISGEELKKSEYSDFNIGDLIGKDGVEQEYERLLRGVDGKMLVEVDASGKPLRTLGQTDPVSGEDIHLTLDAKLQQAAFLSMGGVKKGALVAATPDGQILALVSKPSFDPNLFTMGETYRASEGSYQNISQLLTDNDSQPLLNRAIGGTYPPGSTFKIVVASSGLEGKAIDERFEVEDTGVISVGSFSFANWYFTQYGRKEGAVDVVKAIKRSNDIFFYKLAEKVGAEHISEFARRFGLGKRLGIDLMGESAGLVPTEAWKKENLSESWYLGDTYHYGIGQGYLLTTPLQVNAFTQVVANGGLLYRPHLLLDKSKEPISQNLLNAKTLSLVTAGMVESCAQGGVAWPLFSFSVKNNALRIDGKNILEVPEATTSAGMKDYRQVVVACKTGTAQYGGEKDMPHAWITLFAPAYNPQIVVTVLSEASGEGSNVAAPIAKKVLLEWFSRPPKVQ